MRLRRLEFVPRLSYFLFYNMLMVSKTNVQGSSQPMIESVSRSSPSLFGLGSQLQASVSVNLNLAIDIIDYVNGIGKCSRELYFLL